MKSPGCLPNKLLMRQRAGRWGALAICLLLTAGLWLIVLPWLGTQPDLRIRIDREQAHGINPGAMFYSELEVMPEILRRLDSRLPLKNCK